MHRKIDITCRECGQDSTVLLREDQPAPSDVCSLCEEKIGDPNRAPTPAHVAHDILKRLAYLAPEDHVMRGVVIRAVIRDALNDKVKELTSLVERLLVDRRALSMMLTTHMNSRRER